MNNEIKVDNLAKILWDYLQLHQNPVKSDIIFCLCSHDTRVAERASELMLAGYGKYLVFSGGLGKLTKGTFQKSEAETFADIAIEVGVKREKIITEKASSNTGENIRFTHELLQKRDTPYSSMILVQKPYMERRTLATFLKQWPGNDIEITVTSPQLSYEEYMFGNITKKEVINIMVGDMQRIKEYPKFGFQVEQTIPDDVWNVFIKLVSLGYDKHLITN
jgi:uncharacterized SAM-binding protein YcdF (DUF218 family)